LNDEGWGSSEVTGGQCIVTLTGVRHFGDPAQDYIFSDAVRYNWGSARKTQLRITRGDGSQILWDVTLAVITDGGGDANSVSDITVEIHGNGAPTIIVGGYIGQLTVVSVAGSTSGKTKLYVNPAKEALNSYKYKTAASVDLPVYDELCTTGWTTWDGTADITATTGHQIVVVEVVTATNLARKAGRQIVTSLA
jgi:hypothetical protein